MTFGIGWANVCTTKSGACQYSVKCAETALEESGFTGDLVIQVDKEHGAIHIARAVATRRAAAGRRTIVRKAPRKSKGSMGSVERFHQTVEGMTRCNKLQVEMKYNVKLNSQSVFMPWAVRHAAWTITRYCKREDGQTAWQALHRKP